MPTGQYKRKRKDPEIELRKRFVIDERFKCWRWIGHRQTQGYGTIQLNGVLWVASRLSWTIVKGPIPQGLHVLHTCDNPGCVNPDHLFLGTHKDNMEDMVRKNRGKICGWSKEQRARRGAASRLWWANATQEQKDRVHKAKRNVG